MDAGLVREGAEACDGVVERDRDLDSVGDQVLDLPQHGQVVLALGVLGVGDHHARNEATEGRDAVALANAEHRGVDVGRAGLEGAVGVGDGAARVVVEVALDVARHDAAEGADEVVDLARVGAPDRVGDTDAVDADLVDGAVDRQEVDEVRAERVLGREADLDALALDELDDLDGRLDDVRDVLAVRVLAEERRRANDDVDAVNACKVEQGERVRSRTGAIA